MTGLQRNRRRCCCSFLLSLVAWCLFDDNHVVEAQRLLRRVGKSINNYNVTGARFLASDGVTEMVHVIISLKENVSSFSYGGLALTSNFERTNAVRATIRASEWIDILEHADVVGIEEDPSVYPMGEQMPWGVYAVQGDMMGVPLPPQVFEQYDPTYDAVTNPNCFAVCIVDSGVLLSHPDFPYKLGQANVQGQPFSVPLSEPWYAPVDVHGTHIAGTIFAIGGNDIGVVGIIPNNADICFNVARVFDDNGSITSTSNIDLAVEWCVDKGSRVINLSLGTIYASANSAAIYQKVVEQENVLVVAAAGNNGNSELLYPASYPQVISVASVDQDKTHSTFSQYNSMVDIAAPGKNILSLSTTPSLQIIDSTGNNQIQGSLMLGSSSPSGALTGAPVYCGLGTTPCHSASGNFCIIQRGATTFEEKALNCQNGGGLVAFIYNDMVGTFSGTVGSGAVTIPVVSLSQDDGNAVLMASSLGVNMDGGSYATLSGTSMAAAHVTGVIAKIWAALPGCTNAQIRTAIEMSAMDLGEPGKDDYFGYGLVQAVDAYNYLLTQPSPCGFGNMNTTSTIPQSVQGRNSSYLRDRRRYLRANDATVADEMIANSKVMSDYVLR